jgi:hypothetical protein
MSHHGTEIGQMALNSYTFSAVTGKLTYNGTDVYGIPVGNIVVGRNMVFVSGIKLNEGTDYTVSTDGTAITLSESIPAGETINIIAMGVFSVSGALSVAQADAAYYKRRNRLLNSSFLASQINGTSLVHLSSGNDAYIADGFIVGYSSTSAAVTAQVVNKITPSGSPNRLRISVTTPDSGGAASTYLYVKQHMEGLFTCDLQFGQAAGGGKTMLGRAGINTPLAGTHTIFYTNAGLNRTYLGTVTIAPGEVNTDVIKYVRFTPDISGTWATDTTRGITMGVCFHAGTAVQGSTSNAWIGTTSYGSVSQVNGLSSVNTFEVFDLALWDVSGMGSQAVPFYEVPDPMLTLYQGRRYYEPGNFNVVGSAYAANSYLSQTYHIVTKRQVPQLTFNTTTMNNAGSATSFTADGLADITAQIIVATATTGVTWAGTWTAAALL